LQDAHLVADLVGHRGVQIQDNIDELDDGLVDDIIFEVL
jgi:hypothetical protein